MASGVCLMDHFWNGLCSPLFSAAFGEGAGVFDFAMFMLSRAGLSANIGFRLCKPELISKQGQEEFGLALWLRVKVFFGVSFEDSAHHFAFGSFKV